MGRSFVADRAWWCTVSKLSLYLLSLISLFLSHISISLTFTLFLKLSLFSPSPPLSLDPDDTPLAALWEKHSPAGRAAGKNNQISEKWHTRTTVATERNTETERWSEKREKKMLSICPSVSSWKDQKTSPKLFWEWKFCRKECKNTDSLQIRNTKACNLTARD